MDKLLEVPFARCTKQYIDKAQEKIDSILNLKKYIPELHVIINIRERPLLLILNKLKYFISSNKKAYAMKNKIRITRKTKEIVNTFKTV